MLIEATSVNVFSPNHHDFFFSKEFHHGFLFPKGLQYSFVDHILCNIPKTPTKISIMILGVVILTINVFSKLLFVGELVILRKNDELLLHNDFLSLYHIKCILNLCIGDL